MLKTSTKDAARDIVKAIRPVFKQYSYQSRKSAWEGLTSPKGAKGIEKLLTHPDTNADIVAPLSFKDWMRTGRGK